MTDTDAQVAFLKAWAADNKCYFEDKGEVGFFRECVGIISGDHYPSYRVYGSGSAYAEVYLCPEAFPPEGVEDAYHKADVLAVLGRGREAISQLYVWVKHLTENDVVVSSIPRQPEHDIDAFWHGFNTRVLIKRGDKP